MGELTTQEKKQAQEAKRAAEELETETNLHSLMHSRAGKWILRSLIEEFETNVRPGQRLGHNSEDAYRRGRQDLAGKYRSLVIEHFGHEGIADILKGD